jgi:hypothetical protein
LKLPFLELDYTAIAIDSVISLCPMVNLSSQKGAIDENRHMNISASGLPSSRKDAVDCK